MNREAVALAADSAVTVGSKIHQSANKLFTLSKIFPVGIMISQSADFMGVPWETVIKMYREATINEPERGLISDYCEHFLNSIANKKLCPELHQRRRVFHIAIAHLERVFNEANYHWASSLFMGESSSARRRDQIVKSTLSEYAAFLEKHEDFPFKRLTANNLMRIYKEEINQAVDAAFSSVFHDHFRLTKSTKDIAIKCAKLSILKDTASDLHTTVAITGYGVDEFFPSLELIEIDGLIDGELKITGRRSSDIDRAGNVCQIIPLAQSEMVHRWPAPGSTDTHLS